MLCKSGDREWRQGKWRCPEGFLLLEWRKDKEEKNLLYWGNVTSWWGVS